MSSLKIKIVNFSELGGCLSPYRYFGQCTFCKTFKFRMQYDKSDIRTTITNLENKGICQPIVDSVDEIQRLLDTRKDLYQQIKDISAQLKEYNM